MLALVAHLPEVAFDAGDILIREGYVGGIWVLMSGRLQVRKGEMAVNTIDEAGAIIGEISVLLGHPCGATIEAMEPTRTRYAGDGGALLLGDPEITRLIAVGLAQRLNYVTAYLADLKHQTATCPASPWWTRCSPGSHSGRTRPRSGSARDPDPEY